MKFLILFLIFINTSFSAYISEGSIGNASKKFYTNKKRCEKAESQKCHFWKKDFISGAVKLDYIMQDDPSKPLYTRREKVTSCADEDACIELMKTYSCSPEFSDYQVGYDKSQSRLYCIKLLGYEKVQSVEKHLVKDDALHATKLAEKSALEAKIAGLAAVQAKRDAGNRVINLMLLRNSQKALNPGQKKQILEAYSLIKSLLEVGNLEQAKSEIQAASPDGVLVTSEDKSVLIAEIDKYL